jgi:succinate-acetate transporter protein
VGITGPDKQTMGIFLALWGVFTFAMFMATLRLTTALQVVFGSLTVLFFLLAAGDYFDAEKISHIGGWEGVFCGLSAMYTGLAQVLNEVYGKVVCPLDRCRKK